MSLVLDLHITHERFGSRFDPSIHGRLHYPNDLNGPLNEADVDKIRQYRSDYNNRSSNTISFILTIVSMSGCLHSELVCLLFLQVHRETDHFLQHQEFSLRNPTNSSTTTTRRFPHRSSRKWVTSSTRIQLYVSIWILMTHPYFLNQTLTHHLVFHHMF